MRHLLLSDVHANLIALEAVLQHAERHRFDAVMFLGDAVGYYTEPDAVTTVLRSLQPHVAIMGNHDAMMLSTLETRDDTGNGESLVAAIVTRHGREVSPENIAFLRGLRSTVVGDGWEATHGAPRDPWEYLTNVQVAQANVAHMRTNLVFVGHTHVPVAFASVTANDRELWRTVAFRAERQLYRIPPRAKVMFNPGSVGQPRDGIALASYAIFDEAAQTVEVFRVPFDVVKVQRRIAELGYATVLGTRLTVGR